MVYDTPDGGLMHVQERHAPVQGFSYAVGWLLWVLPGAGIALLVVYLLNATSGFDVRAMAALVASGHGGVVVGYLFGLTGWGLGVTGQAALEHWPVVMMGGALTLLVWMLRHL